MLSSNKSKSFLTLLARRTSMARTSMRIASRSVLWELIKTTCFSYFKNKVPHKLKLVKLINSDMKKGCLLSFNATNSNLWTLKTQNKTGFRLPFFLPRQKLTQTRFRTTRHLQVHWLILIMHYYSGTWKEIREIKVMPSNKWCAAEMALKIWIKQA